MQEFCQVERFFYEEVLLGLSEGCSRNLGSREATYRCVLSRIHYYMSHT